MNTEKICPNCRKPLPPDVPLGLCPECLIKSGFPTEGGGVAGPVAGERFVPPPVEEIAALFPQLEIIGLIGKGGMGAVYKARQPALDRFVALKVLPPAFASDPGFAERFNREARALARLSHPNIVAVYDFGKAGALHYVIMEFIDGANLRELERSHGLSSEQALAIVPQICEALQFAHNEGIVHRDIKPENLLLDKKGRLKITDFGIAKIVGLGTAAGSLTGEKDVVGTPHYMAPEQIERPLAVDHRADIYSLGVVFYEMLTGELPLGKFAPPSKKVEVDVRLDEVVLHALEKEPSRRYQQASHVKTDVETITKTPPPPSVNPAVGAGPVPGTPTPLPTFPPTSDKGVLPASLLAFFFGWLGAHRFYVGKPGTAVVQMLTFGGLGIWMLVDLILLLCKAFTDGEGRRMTSWMPNDQAPGVPGTETPPGGATVSEKALLPAFLLALFFGVFGAHRFYLGKSGTAVLQLLTFGGFGIWVVIDWILLLCQAFTDGQGKRVTNWLHNNGPKPDTSSTDVPKRPLTPEEQAARTRLMVVAPAIGLMVAAAWRLFVAIHVLAEGPFFATASLWFFRIIPALLVLFGAWQMFRIRSYPWAIAAAALAILFGKFPGIVMGIWALIILLLPLPKEAFAASAAVAGADPDKSRRGDTWKPFLIIAVVVCAVGLLASVAYSAARTVIRNASDDSNTEEATKTIAMNFPLATDGRFSIDNINGKIEVTGWDHDEVSVKGMVHAGSPERAEAVKVESASSSNSVAIHTRLPSSFSFNFSWLRRLREERVDYVIQVPRHARLSKVSSVNGTIDVSAVSGDIDASTVNGVLQIKDAAASLNLTTVNGQIDAEMASLGEGQAVELNAVNGRIETTLPADASATFAVHTLNGFISSEFPALHVKRNFPIGSDLKGELGDGGSKVKATTVNGGIIFRKVQSKPKHEAEQPEADK